MTRWLISSSEVACSERVGMSCWIWRGSSDNYFASNCPSQLSTYDSSGMQPGSYWYTLWAISEYSCSTVIALGSSLAISSLKAIYETGWLRIYIVGGEKCCFTDKEEERDLLLYNCIWFFFSLFSLLCLFWRMLRPQSAQMAGCGLGGVGPYSSAQTKQYLKVRG